MSSLNPDGSKIQQNNRTSRHTGHCIEISDAVTDSRLECHLLADGRGLPAPTPPGPVDPGPPVANLKRHWSAEFPLLSLEGDEVVYTQEGTGQIESTTFGLPSIEFDDTSQGYVGAGPTVVAATENIALYCLISWETAQVTEDVQHYLSRIGHSDRQHIRLGCLETTEAVQISTFRNPSLQKTTAPGLGSGPVARVISLFWDASTLKIQGGIDGVLSGALTSGHSIAPLLQDHHWIGDPVKGTAGAGLATLVGVPIMRALIYSGVGMAHDEGDVADYLLGLVS